MPYSRGLTVAPAQPSGGSAVLPRRPFSLALPAPALSRERMDWEAAVANPARKLGFYFGLAFVFLRFSMLHESLSMLMHVNLYLALLAGFPAIALAVLGGGIQRTCQTRAGRLWLAFLALMILSTPFSSWRGESVTVLTSYLRADYPILFILGGMVLTWKECKMVLGALALSGICTLAMERMFSNMDDSGRLSIEAGGTIANSNDYAAHLLLLLPFVLWVVLVPANRIYKMICLPLLVGGLFIDLKTGSRGALIGMAAGFLMILLKGPGKLRWILGFCAPVAVLASFAFLPSSVVLRFTALFGDDTPQTTAAAKEDVKTAEDSSSARRYLLMKSLEYTWQHPIFGIGAGNFSSYEGGNSKAAGEHGHWQETHNSYTEVSSETGLPAVFCYLGAIVCALSLLNRTMLKARRDKVPIIVASAFCTMLAMAVMGTCMAFLSLGFRFYMPALTGLAICLERVLRMDPPVSAPVAASGLVHAPRSRPMSPATQAFPGRIRQAAR